MKKTINTLFIWISFNFTFTLHAQNLIKVGQNMGTIQNTSILELESNNRGLLLPRLNNTEATALITKAKTNNASGLLIFNTDCKCLQVFDASTTTGRWVTFWNTIGNSGTGTPSPTIGTTYNADVIFRVNNIERLKLTTTGEADFNNQVVRKYSAKVQTISTLNYTITPNDNGSILLIDTAESHNLTIPANLPSGFTCTVIQKGLGPLTFLGEAGITLNQRGNSRTTNGQFATVHLLQMNSSNILLYGDFE